MAYNTLPTAAGPLYNELVDQLLVSRSIAPEATTPRGTFVEKQVRGGTYVYLQVSALGRRKQHYLGPKSPAMTAFVEAARARWADPDKSSENTARLVSMLLQAGALGPSGASAKLLQTLDEHGVFRAGGVLVGSHAFAAYGAMLGVTWTGAYRTDDVDTASDPRVAIAVGEPVKMLDALEFAVPPLKGIPGFDPREPSTSFTSRGAGVRLDLVTAMHGSPTAKKVRTPSLGVHAQPLRFLDFLLADPVPAALIYGRGLLVRIPSPARFALHKLIVAHERRPHEANRAHKDRAQAAALLQWLTAERPGDLELAWDEIKRRGRGWSSRVSAQANRLDQNLVTWMR